MTDRRYYYSMGGRSATFNPARQSMPVMPSSSVYSTPFSGDIQVFPVSSNHRYGNAATPRYQYPAAAAAAAAPAGAPTARPPGTNYSATQDGGLHRNASLQEGNRSRRSTTFDSTTPRPLIITTTTAGRSHTGSHASSGGGGRNSPPPIDDYRASDSLFYTSPHSSIRSRSATRGAPYSATLDNDEYGHVRDQDGFLIPSRPDPYRHTRPAVLYQSNPRHTGPIDLGDDEYQYTTPSELARYDLDHSRRHRRESLDRYSRPNVFYHPDRPGINVSTDTSRPYNGSNLSRSFESRGGPPPTTWGLDRLNRSSNVPLYDASLGVPPPAPSAPPPIHLDIPPSPRERRGSGRNSRPVSLYQEASPRSSHHDDYYRTREEQRTQRELRDLERESQRLQERDFYHDDNVANRGFGLRTDNTLEDDRRERRERREAHREHGEHTKRSDEELDRLNHRDDDHERGERRRSRQKPAKDADERRGSKEDDETGRRRFRDKISGLGGLTAAAVGLAPTHDKDDKADKDKKDSPRLHRMPDENHREDSDEVEIVSSRAADKYRSRDKDAATRERRGRPGSNETSPSGEPDAKDRHRRDAEARLNGGSPTKPSRDSEVSDEEKPRARRHRHSSSFNPNDAEGIQDVKDKLAAMKLSENAALGTGSSSPPPRELAPEKAAGPSQGESSRGRDSALTVPEERQVRVVSPPRDKADGKPIKGILKQPTTVFPEDPNPIREGVAPHKKDEKLREVPPGARWTRISRKIVNPEALTIGKERFEVRDDFVIVLRVLSKEEIQTYAAATATLRERRQERDDDRRRHHRRHHNRDEAVDDDDEDDDREGDLRDRTRYRRHRIEDDDADDEDTPQPRRRHHRERSDAGGEHHRASAVPHRAAM